MKLKIRSCRCTLRLATALFEMGDGSGSIFVCPTAPHSTTKERSAINFFIEPGFY
jgi:hypothetical protein